MNTQSYQQCYEILALPDDADWDQADASFRQLVQKWHPDRYDGNDPAEATRRYIEITKAFKKLRDFHKENGALPFATVKSSDELTGTADKTGSTTGYTYDRLRNKNSTEHTANDFRDTNTRRSNIPANSYNQERFRPSRFAMSIAAVFVVGVSLILLFMTKLDRMSSDHYRDEARLQRISEQLAEQPDN